MSALPNAPVDSQRALPRLQPPAGMLAALAGANDDMGNSSIMPTMKHAPTRFWRGAVQ